MKILLNDQNFLSFLEGEKLNVIDGGARGNLFSPFNKVDTDSIHVIRFDPDPNPNTIIEAGKAETIIQGALWDKSEQIEFNITNQPAVSSTFEPNLELIESLWQDKKMIKARSIREKVMVKGHALDDLIEEGTIPSLDFIKLDIHGSEYECIKGALGSLKNSVIGILAETWTVPVYKGQKLHGEFEYLLNQHNFFLFDQLKSGGAKRNVSSSNFHKHQIFKYDSLYFKNMMDGDKQDGRIQILKSIAIADIFGFYGYALQILEQAKTLNILKTEVYNYISKALSTRSDFITKYKQKAIGKLLEMTSRF